MAAETSHTALVIALLLAFAAAGYLSFSECLELGTMTCSQGRAPAGAANLVASILFRPPRRDEEDKDRKVNPDQHSGIKGRRGNVTLARID